MKQNFLTVEELATELRVPKSWIYLKTRQAGPGAIPKLKVGKYLRFRLEDVLAWLQADEQDSRGVAV